EVAQWGRDAESAGREAWAAATRVGDSIPAATPNDVRLLGARVLNRSARRVGILTPPEGIAGPTPTSPAIRDSGGTVEYGALRAVRPSDQDLAELRRQQAEFAKTTRQIDLRNSWFAAPVLAAPLAVMGLEVAGAWSARAIGREAKQAAVNFVEREPYLRVGDNWATRAGRRAHAALRERLDQKPGWAYEPDVPQLGPRQLKPDVGAPARNPAFPKERFQMEMKPNTPTGRRAGARAAQKYEEGTGNKTRVIYYNPGDFI
ncbi:MAG TPA: hypothetical protein VHN73_09605, partial [Phenylobacterium sp.]|nr:hypothetical protein [Phenylobacterium sp.]